MGFGRQYLKELEICPDYNEYTCMPIDEIMNLTHTFAHE